MSSLLPPSSTPLERALELLAQMRANAIDVPLRALWRAETCPADLLPWLAWGLSLDEWDAAWPEAVRRARIAAAIVLQRRKGTPQCVKDAIASFGWAASLVEWWQTTPPGTPHTFNVLLTLGGGFGAPSADFIDQVISEITRTKPARSHFTFTLATTLTGGIGLIGRVRPLVWSRHAVTA